MAKSGPHGPRYKRVAKEKATGVTYTPRELADFVATEMLRGWRAPKPATLRVLDPAVGEGALLVSLLKKLPHGMAAEVHGFESSNTALRTASERLEHCYPKGVRHLIKRDFLAFVLNGSRGTVAQRGLFDESPSETFDLIIANPPYVRTQIIGSKMARALARQFHLDGRVDLYHAFVVAIASVLRPRGRAGIIVSNRFMTTKAGASLRRVIRTRFNLLHVWDLGDTKIFDAAVLPAVLIVEGLDAADEGGHPRFTSIYETTDACNKSVTSVTAALENSGVVAVSDGRRFRVEHGVLDDRGGIWRVATEESDAWVATVRKHTWANFRQLGKIRVGVKTCADDIFIRQDWSQLPPRERPELLRPLTTHHIGRRFRADSARGLREILYPHECANGKRRPVDLTKYPRSREYLEGFRARLEARSYVLEAGRRWYEIWVPQDPDAWSCKKLVFRDIAEKPCFWIDEEGMVVNGDCYWLSCDRQGDEELLWLAIGIANSTFAEAFYDRLFNNKLYAGRRRFMTQYVEKFPLPDPQTPLARRIMATAKAIYEGLGTSRRGPSERTLDNLVWSAFGLPVEEISR